MNRPVSSLYEELLALTQKMLYACQQGYWEEVQDLENRRSAILPHLPQRLDMLPRQHQQHIRQLLEACLAVDSEVMEYAAARHGSMRRLLGRLIPGSVTNTG